MYIVAAYENNQMIESSMRLMKGEHLVLKHLRYIAKNQWPNNPMSLNILLSNGWFKVYCLETNKLSKSPKQIPKGKIKKWIDDEKFAKVKVDAR